MASSVLPRQLRYEHEFEAGEVGELRALGGTLLHVVLAERALARGVHGTDRGGRKRLGYGQQRHLRGVAAGLPGRPGDSRLHVLHRLVVEGHNAMTMASHPVGTHFAYGFGVGRQCVGEL